MKQNIVFITTGFLPVPSIKGGAVETLVDDLIYSNEEKQKFNFTVFSIFDKKAFEKANNFSSTNIIFYKAPKVIKYIDMVIYFVLTTFLKKERKAAYKYLVQRIFYLNYVSKKLSVNNFDKIIIENNPTLFLALKWRNNYKKYSNRYYYHLHNEINDFYGCKEIMRSCDSIICISKYIQDYVIKRLDIDANKTCVLNNCIDIKKFSQNILLSEKIELRKKYEIDLNDFLVIFTGRIIREKGILELLDSILLIDNPKIKLLIIGSSFSSSNLNSDFEKELKKKAENLGNRIIFTGYVDYNEINKYYAIADVAVLPSMWEEPAGLTILEACASKLPLITTISGGIPEYVDSNSAILLKKDENIVVNLKKEIINLYKKDKGYLDKIGRRNYENSLLFDIDNYYNNFYKIFRN